MGGGFSEHGKERGERLRTKQRLRTKPKAGSTRVLTMFNPKPGTEDARASGTRGASGVRRVHRRCWAGVETKNWWPKPDAPSESGAKVTALQTLARGPSASVLREASGVRRVHRRCCQFVSACIRETVLQGGWFQIGWREQAVSLRDSLNVRCR